MGFRVNMADVKTNDFEALPAGTYQCYITNGEERVTSEDAEKAPNEPYIRWEFTIADGEERAGRKVWTNTLVAHEKSLWVLKGLLQATDLFSNEELDSDDINFRIHDDDEGDGPALVGSTVAVRVGRSTYNGEIRNEVKGFKKASDSSDSGLMPG
jgi:hypothetical protein